MGFGGSVIGRMLTPALTTLAIPIADIAQRLVDRALRELDELTDEPGELIVPDLVLGASAYAASVILDLWSSESSKSKITTGRRRGGAW